MRHRRNRLFSITEFLLIFLVDVVSIAAAFKISTFLRLDILPLVYEVPHKTLPFESVADIWWIFLIWIFFFLYEGLYIKRLSYWDEVRTICKASFFASIAVFAVVSLGQLSSHVSRTVIVLMGLLSFVVVPTARMTAKSIMRKRGLLKRRALIIGAGETGKLVAKALRKEPNFGYRVVGYLDDDPRKVGTTVDGIKVHKGVDSASKYLNHCSITDLIIAMPGAGKERLQELINKYQHAVDTLLVVPDLFGMAVVGTSLKHFFDEQAFALQIENNLARPFNYFTKRAFDYLTSLLLLMPLSVPLVVISAFIKTTSKGPVIYKQKRIGKNGKPFLCFKFRTMYEDADKRLEEILRSSVEAKEEWEHHYKLRDDPRVTRIGRFLRRTSLDEIPQIFNVLAGQMSLVGPRPVTQKEIDEYYKDSAELCFSVLPGITGLWQVSGRSNTSYEYRIALDSWYVRNWNLWLDIIILIKTLRVVFRTEGAC